MTEQISTAQNMILSRKREWQSTPFLPGEFHDLRSLVGYSPGDHKELDTTESRTQHNTHTHTHTHTHDTISEEPMELVIYGQK